MCVNYRQNDIDCYFGFTELEVRVCSIFHALHHKGIPYSTLSWRLRLFSIQICLAHIGT